MPRLPMNFACETSECTLACLTMIGAHFGLNVSVAELRERHPVSLLGLTLRDALRLADTLGLTGRVLRCEPEDLRKVALPAMLHWDLEHMVVLESIRGERFVIHDPARGIRTVSKSELSEHFTGIAVEFECSASFEPQARPRSLSLFDLIGSFRRLRTGILAILALSVVLESLLLLQPVLLRSIVDHAIAVTDSRYVVLGGVLLIGGALCLGAMNYLRDLAVLRTGTNLNLSIMQRLFSHTLRLPLPFFEKRPLGHLMERYRVTDHIERFMTTSLPLALIDGLMSLLAVAIMAWIAPMLALAAALGLGAYAALRFARSRAMHSAEEALAHAKGEESGFLVEALRTIFTTKANVLEENRFQTWTTYYGDLIEAQRAFGQIDAVIRSGKILLSALGVAIFVVVGGAAVLRGELTVGAWMALMLLNAHFLARSMLFVDRAFEFHLIGVRLTRLEDLVFAKPESHGATGLQAMPLTGHVEVAGLAFRYGVGDRTVLTDMSFALKPGDFVALVGENGAGKTTLMKLLLGLYVPTAGEIRYDDVALDSLSLSSLREQIGVVSQDDQLILGTIAQNIAVFDADIDMDQVVRCATLADVHDDICATPLGYRTRVGDLGSPFSEGQKQKIFLARALYRNPPILFMDEGTANIAPVSEDRILNNLKSLGMTMLLITHRSATQRHASRVLVLKQGTVVENEEHGRAA